MIPAPVTIVQPRQVAAGALIRFRGRLLLVRRVFGTDPAAPVIVEELTAAPLAGQLGLWSLDAVHRLLETAEGGGIACRSSHETSFLPGRDNLCYSGNRKAADGAEDTKGRAHAPAAAAGAGRARL